MSRRTPRVVNPARRGGEYVPWWAPRRKSTARAWDLATGLGCDLWGHCVWGGPPGGGRPPATAARDLAFVKRGAPLRSFLAESGCEALDKPFAPAELLRRIRALAVTA